VNRTVPTVAIAFLAASLGGCNNVAAVRVNGKVIAGDISLITAVGDSDKRLSGPGIAGAKVEIIGKIGDAAGNTVGEATSDPMGNFQLVLKTPDAVKAPAEFRVTAPGRLPAEAIMLIPPTDRRVLVVLRSMSGGGSPGPAKPSGPTKGK
jgi:hypothetical protein